MSRSRDCAADGNTGGRGSSGSWTRFFRRIRRDWIPLSSSEDGVDMLEDGLDCPVDSISLRQMRGAGRPSPHDSAAARKADSSPHPFVVGSNGFQYSGASGSTAIGPAEEYDEVREAILDSTDTLPGNRLTPPSIASTALPDIRPVIATHEDKELETIQPDISTFVDEIIQQVGIGRIQFRLFFIVGLTFMSDAMEMMLLSFLSPIISCEWSLTSTQQTLLTTVVFAGMLIGSTFWGNFSDVYGRRLGCMVTMIWTAISALASALVPSFAWLLIVRGLVGVGLGGMHVVFSLLMEFLPPSMRSVFLLLSQTFWTIGSVSCAALGWLILPAFGWRWLLFISAIPISCLACISYFVVPESPRYLATTKQVHRTRELLLRVAEVNKKTISPTLLGALEDACNAETSSISTTTAATTAATATSTTTTTSSSSSSTSCTSSSTSSTLPSSGYSVLEEGNVAAHSRGIRNRCPTHCAVPNPHRSSATTFRSLLNNNVRKLTFMLWVIWFSCSFVYYGTVLLSSTISDMDPASDPAADDGQGSRSAMEMRSGSFSTLTATSTLPPNDTPDCTQSRLSREDYETILVESFAELPGLLLCLLFVDRYGRRTSQSLMFLGCSVSLGFLMLFRSRAPQLIALFVSRAFIVGAFCIVYMYTPEVYPTVVRSTGVGVANVFARIGGILSPYVLQILPQSSGGSIFPSLLVYALSAAAAGFSTLFLPVETAGRKLSDTLREMQNA